MENKTQCPNCSSIFVISDDQYKQSHGKVRCGSCREPFNAALISNQDDELKQDADKGHDEFVEQPSFQNYDFDFVDNLQSELSIEADENEPTISSDDEGLQKPTFVQTEFDMSVNEDTVPIQDQQLISKTGKLVEDKLITESNEPNINDDFQDIGGSDNNGKLLTTILLGIVSLILICGLLYQLWHRQAITWFDDEKIINIIEPIAEPLVGQLSERLGVTLPIRRDLKNLQLLSARTEAHPSRSSTILLRVSLINHSDISQPYPWLELSLTDENGRIVARRSLSPDKYLHNNQVDNHIGARELRPITIEFLSFPKQANGYELKILNN